MKQPESLPGLRAAGAAFLKKLFSRENILALILALVVIAIYIATAADSPLWVYQGF